VKAEGSLESSDPHEAWGAGAEAARPRICLSMNCDAFISSPRRLVESWVRVELEMVVR